MAIKSTQLGSVAGAISDLLATESAIINMIFCNLNSVPEYITVHAVGSGGSVSSANTILSQVRIDANNTFSLSTDKIVLAPGDRIYAYSTNAAMVSATICVVVI